MWRVVIALVLVLSFSLVAAVPVAASPDVSDVWVQLTGTTPYDASQTGVTYNVYFTPGADLAKNVDTITVFFPIDTVPTDAVTVTVDPDGDAVAATTGDATADVAGYRLEVTTPVDITAGNEVRLDIPSVTNPTTGDDYTLNVYTSQETTQVESSTYTIGASSVDTVGVDPTTGTAGVADEYTITFNEGTLGKLDVWDTVTVIFPTGTGIPSSIAPSAVTIDGDTAPADVPLDVAPVVDGRFVTLTVPEDWNPNTTATTVTIVFAATVGITNATYAGSGYIGKAYTSDDLGIVSDPSGYTITAASVSQVAFDAVNSGAEVMVSTTASDVRTAKLVIQTKDQYGNLKDVPVAVTFDLSSSSGTGVFTSDSGGSTVIEDIDISGTANEATFYYKDTTVGPAIITAENAAHGWSDTWDVEVTSETVVELWDGDTLVGEYVTIGDAIGDALAGNVIKAGPGTYVEDISVNKADLTLESTAGAATTFIEGEMTLSADADDFVLGGAAGKGFTLKGGTNYLICLYDTPDVEISYNTLDTGNDIEASDAIRMWGTSAGTSGLTVTQNAFIVTDQYDMGVRSHIQDSVAELTVTNNTFTGTDNTLETSAIELNQLNITTLGSTISGNEITGVGNGVIIGDWTGVKGLVCGTGETAGTLTISDNTFDGCNYGIDLVNTTNTGTDQNIVIKLNTFSNNTYGLAIDYGSIPVDTDNWEPGDFTVKFNDFSDSSEYGLYNNKTTAVDATHNYWGDDTGPSGEGTGMGDAISAYVDYEPWLVTTVSAGEWATGVTSLDARATVGVKVSGATSSATQKIGVARYTENPMATPEFTPLADGFFDVYVEGAGTATEIGIKFYADGMTAQSKVYVWDFFEEVWAECSDQAYNATYGYIWVKVRTAAADVPTVPTISELAGTPFAISVEEVRTLQSIAVTPATASIGVGGTKQFTATGTYNLEPLTEDITTEVTWASSDVSVATIDAAGLATGVAEGTTNITATLDPIVSEEAAVLTVSVWDPMIYDVDEDGVMEIGEVLNAISDYFAGEITITQVLEVIALYF